jgi:putative transposase
LAERIDGVPHPSVLRVRVLTFFSMRNPLKRHYGQGNPHFVTFSCYRRRPLLGTARARDQFVRILDEVRCQHGFRVVGYVVMPEHVHLLISEPIKKDPSKILQALKQKVARILLKRLNLTTSTQLSLPFDGSKVEEAHFWQRRFYDFNVWSEEKLKEKLDYMHANPVQRRLVQHPRDCPWSSWVHYAGKGEVKIRMDSIRGEGENQNPHP